MKIEDLKIAIVYDRLVKWGGAERLLKTISHLLPQAVFFSLKYKPQPALSFLKQHKVITSFLDKGIFKPFSHEILFPLANLAFEQFDFQEFDVVFSIGSAESKSIITNTKTKHLHYALAPTRYLWQDYHLFKASLPPALRPFFSYLAYKQRPADFITAYRPDKIITISHFINTQIQKYYRRPSQVIYPPFDLDYWQNLKPEPVKLPCRQPFWLAVARLAPQKRLDLVIKAAALKKEKVVIIGKGWLKNNLLRLSRRLQSPVYFLDSLTDSQLKYLYLNSLGLIIPQVEDFGYTALEAAALGKPIVYFDQGGSAEILSQYPLAYPYQPQNQQALTSKLTAVKSAAAAKNWSKSSTIKQYFKPFLATRFKDEIKNIIINLIKENPS
ncbi:MAG: glycosyltransferase family 4 protein [bacterium]|nr:glycosyltransferase family 4 protein [bacterium]